MIQGVAHEPSYCDVHSARDVLHEHLSLYYVPGITLGSGNQVANRTDSLCPHEPYNGGGWARQGLKQGTEQIANKESHK